MVEYIKITIQIIKLNDFIERTTEKINILHIFEIDEHGHLLGSMVDILDPIIVRFIFPYSLFFL